MSNYSQRLLASFRRRARHELADMGPKLAAAQLLGTSLDAGLSRAFDLAVGAAVVHDELNGLTVGERVEIAGFLLPIEVDQELEATPPAVVLIQPALRLSFSQSEFLLGSLAPITVKVRAQPGDGQLLRLTLLRNNIPVATSTTSTELSASVPLPIASAGVLYEAQAEYSNFGRQIVRQQLVPQQAVLYGALALPLTSEQVGQLENRLLPKSQLRLTFSGQRQRMVVYLPPGVSLLQITQPSDNDADQTRAFLAQPYTLPGAGRAGTLLQSNTEFYSGGFTLDFFLTIA